MVFPGRANRETTPRVEESAYGRLRAPLGGRVGRKKGAQGRSSTGGQHEGSAGTEGEGGVRCGSRQCVDQQGALRSSPAPRQSPPSVRSCCRRMCKRDGQSRMFWFPESGRFTDDGSYSGEEARTGPSEVPFQYGKVKMLGDKLGCPTGG